MYKDKIVVALLPMKACSERITGKNFREFGGKPMFRWILDTLLSIGEIDLIIINTDAREILAQHGLEDSKRVRIRDRKEELLGDFTSMNLILKDDIEAEAADCYLMTHATNPLLGRDTIRKALRTFMESDDSIDSLFTVNRFQTRFYREDLSPVNHDPANLVRTQDLEPWFEENSCLYVFTRASFAATNARIGLHPLMLETPRLESIDIDEREDWVMAEALVIYSNEGTMGSM